MGKPLGYYTNYTPGDTGILADIQQTWGDNLENLNEAELAWAIYQLGYQLWQDAEGGISDEVEELVQQRINRHLPNIDKLGLIQALVERIKEA